MTSELEDDLSETCHLRSSSIFTGDFRARGRAHRVGICERRTRCTGKHWVPRFRELAARDDYPTYAARHLFIRTKSGAIQGAEHSQRISIRPGGVEELSPVDRPLPTIVESTGKSRGRREAGSQPLSSRRPSF